MTPSNLTASSRVYGFDRFVKWFVISGGLILAITGAAKIVSAFGHAKLLYYNDPITEIRFRDLMWLVGSLEVVVAGVCLFTKKNMLSVLLLASLSTNFLLYRIGLWWKNWEHCSCLGNLTD